MTKLLVCAALVGAIFLVPVSAGDNAGFSSGRGVQNGISFFFASHPTVAPRGFLRLESGDTRLMATPTCLAVSGSTATAGFEVVESDMPAYPVGATVHLFIWDNGAADAAAPIDALTIGAANAHAADSCPTATDSGTTLDQGDLVVSASIPSL